ncbi:zinc-dependent alcohol dehydrogenase [Halobiforma nitratireducens]|uniref:Alcohol dehydrogenase zinc-binding domain-containing protein n=1 Tax=Halobiforma nitratireducens JCM 10879 TaxID=1227454 RepID=M0MK13_9EURY|nr:zinc-binding alcohol dehydrogenase [Halobiforma nitratireducens]EMA45728.1 alcohol dehydrogenase zinc-binding domain-containing protein [Halobiforma nitratireducens JCM 10879]
MTSRDARTLYFTGPRTVDIERRAVPEPGPEELRLRSLASAVSAGTECLVYRGDAPTELSADETLEAFDGDLSFPLSYGYATVGEVDAVGEAVDDDWLGRRVFAYNPHESHVVATPAAVVPVPTDISTRHAALFANLETAVTFLLDGDPMLGERVAVLGQGIVGLLTTALLAETGLSELVTFDAYERRRERSEAFGADRSLDPDRGIAESFTDVADGRADLTYELSGNPDALDDAIAATGFDGRVVVGSWYGTEPTTLELGGRFHRDRIDVHSSQVSTIDPQLSGRWSRGRRHDLTWEWLRRLDLSAVFTHEFPLEDAGEAYELLTERPEEAIQVLFTYD